jgi:hypothetical protein
MTCGTGLFLRMIITTVGGLLGLYLLLILAVI